MLSSKLSRSVSYFLFAPYISIFTDVSCLQLPRATSAFSRMSSRLPSTSSFVRYQSNGGEEKVKGQVIGIDLGMRQFFHASLEERSSKYNGL